MFVRHVPAWSKQEPSFSSGPSWSSPAWGKPTATQWSGWEWKPTPPQASSVASFPTTTTPYSSYYTTPTPTPTASSQVLSAATPTATTSDLFDILSSPTSLPGQTTSTNGDSPNSLGPSPSLEGSGQSSTSAPFPSESAKQEEFPKRDPGKSNVVIGVMCGELLSLKLQEAESSPNY